MEFLSVFFNGILTGCVLAQMALPLSLMYGVLKLVNFAHGELLVGGMLLMCFLINTCDIPAFMATIILILLYIGLFLFLNRIIFSRIQSSIQTIQFINMMALSIIFFNLSLLFFKSDTYSFNVLSDLKILNIFGLSLNFKKIIAASISIFNTCLFFLFLNKTLIGKSIRAVSINPEIAKTLGMNTQKIFKIALILIAILLSLSCFSLLLTMDISILNAPEITLTSFIIVILGGLGSIPGTILSALIVGINESIIGYYGSSLYKSTITFFIFIGILLLKPYGLLGKK
ncbi:MAG: High-affinity branched-chain amino acid transport system permease protein LivH [Holosporales bacterium]